MKVEVELLPAHAKLLSKWASVGRTFDATDHLIAQLTRLLEGGIRVKSTDGAPMLEGRLAIDISQADLDTLMEKISHNEMERSDIHAPLESLHMTYRGALWDKERLEEMAMKDASLVDIEGMTSLTKGHIPELVKRAKDLAASKMSDDVINRQIEESRKTMYVDDYPGLRGDSQMNVVIYTAALKIRAAKTKPVG